MWWRGLCLGVMFICSALFVSPLGLVQVCNLNPVVWVSDTQSNSHNAQKYINLQVQVANLNPQRETTSGRKESQAQDAGDAFSSARKYLWR